MRKSVVVFLSMLGACSSERAPKQPVDTLPPLAPASALPPIERTLDVPFCEAKDSTLLAVLRGAPPLAPADTPYIRSPDDFDDPGSKGSCALRRAMELAFAAKYEEIRMDSGPSVYVVGQTRLATDRTVYALRVPGMYDPDRVDLYVFDTTGHEVGEPLKVAGAWGDAGERMWVRSWLVDINRDGSLDVVRHTCFTVDDLESDSAATAVERNELEQVRWTGTQFGEAGQVTDSATVERFAMGAQSCLPNKRLKLTARVD